MLEHELIARPGPQDRLLLLVHGYGESPAPMVDRLDRIDPDGRFVALVPRAPFVHKEQEIWHRVLSGESGLASEQYLESLGLLGELVDSVCAKGGFDPAAVVYGGFSQGAGLAIGLSVTEADRPAPAGCLAFCGFAPPIPTLAVSRRRAKALRLLMLVALDDVFVPLDASRHSAAAFAELGCDVTYRELAMPHTVDDASADMAGAWLRGELGAGGVLVESPGEMWGFLTELWDLRD